MQRLACAVQSLSNSDMSAGLQGREIADDVEELSCVDPGRDQHGVGSFI